MNAPEPTGGLVTPDGAATQKILLSADVEEALYEVRRKIYPRAVRGWFAGWRWSLVCFTQLLFYGTVWLTWNGRQAVLFDLAQRKFYIFGLVLWPQDFIYLTALLVISALSLFLFTAVAGRLFCGYACPQTVYTEIFLWIERRVEGDRGARIKLDQGPKDSRQIRQEGDQAQLLDRHRPVHRAELRRLFHAHPYPDSRNLECATGTVGSFWILFYSLATYGNAGFLREQVCKYMCPYARFQSAMFDRDTMIITYDRERGEPRGGRSRKSDPAQLGLGSCVDCTLCVQVCPTGIDIRNGLQYECIGCAACVDACDQVMDKMGYARGLIRYSTENALINTGRRRNCAKRVARPRMLIYARDPVGGVVAMARLAGPAGAAQGRRDPRPRRPGARGRRRRGGKCLHPAHHEHPGNAAPLPVARQRRRHHRDRLGRGGRRSRRGRREPAGAGAGAARPRPARFEPDRIRNHGS